MSVAPDFAKPRTPAIRRGLDESSIIIIDDSSSGSGPRRDSRATKASAANYDMRYHPMDRTMRPKALATLKHHPATVQDSELSHTDVDESYPSRSSRSGSTTLLETPEATSAKGNESVGKRRRSPRTPAKQKALYDITKHPMDDVLSSSDVPTPKKKRKSNVRARSIESAPDVRRSVETTDNDEDDNSDDVEVVRGPATTNPLNHAFWPCWPLLEPLDQRLYALQHGLPDSSILPRTWPQVARILMDERWFTPRQYKAWGGEPQLRSRYEDLRQHIQGKEAADGEPHSKKDWKAKWAEDWEVFNVPPGGSYAEGRRLPRIAGVRASGELVLEERSSSPMSEGSNIVVDTSITTLLRMGRPVQPRVPMKAPAQAHSQASTHSQTETQIDLTQEQTSDSSDFSDSNHDESDDGGGEWGSRLPRLTKTVRVVTPSEEEFFMQGALDAPRQATQLAVMARTALSATDNDADEAGEKQTADGDAQRLVATQPSPVTKRADHPIVLRSSPPLPTCRLGTSQLPSTIATNDGSTIASRAQRHFLTPPTTRGTPQAAVPGGAGGSFDRRSGHVRAVSQSKAPAGSADKVPKPSVFGSPGLRRFGVGRATTPARLRDRAFDIHQDEGPPRPGARPRVHVPSDRPSQEDKENKEERGEVLGWEGSQRSWGQLDESLVEDGRAWPDDSAAIRRAS